MVVAGCNNPDGYGGHADETVAGSHRVRLLAAPASRPGALGLLLLTAFVLWIASLAVRRMQISYGAET